MSRGSSIRPGLVTPEIANKNIIASSNFLIIRPKDILGAVVAAWLCTSKGSAKLQSLSIGAAIQHIPASRLRELVIDVPTKQDQDRIKEMFLASQELYESTLSLAEQQWLTATSQINQLMSEVA